MSGRTLVVLVAVSVSGIWSARAAGAGVWYDCWDCPYQCYGDVDCQSEGIFDYRVGTSDLQAFADYWKLKYPPYNPCLDVNRDLAIDAMDFAIVELWLMKPNIWGDCPQRPLRLEPMEPNSLAVGSVRTIRWTDIPDDCSRSYNLHYSTDNGQSWQEIDANTVENACSYDWLVPGVISDQCLLGIMDADPPVFPSEPIFISDRSDEPFAIYECPGPIEGDLDGNCYADFRDFAILVSDWPVEPGIEGLAGFAENWLACGNPYDPACGDGGQ